MKTVLDSVIAGCRHAMLSGKPIIMLRTNEIELVRDLVASDQLVVRISRKPRAVDEPRESYFLTRDMEPCPPVLLSAAKKDKNQDINIRLVKKEELPKFSDKLGQTGWPMLYVVQPYEEDPVTHVPRTETDFDAYLEQFLRSRFSGTAEASSVMLIYGENTPLPNNCRDYCEIIEEPYPEQEEIQELLYDYGHYDRAFDSKTVRSIADELLGISIYEIRRILQGLSVMPLPDFRGAMISDERAVKQEIQHRKEQLLKRDSLLELVRVNREENTSFSGSGSMVGGMGSFKRWVRDQKKSIRESALLKREAGAMPPKGVLLCGIPGCGKSMAVQAVAQELQIPLLKMEIGQLMGKYVGDSEHNMARALRIAEAMAPCVLFIDELDKAFDGAGSGGNDNSSFKRMFGTLLGWMQDCRKMCFIFATANDISALPKEFFRSGRFDCMYSLYMPTIAECVEIFKKQMQRAQRRSSRREPLFQEDCMGKSNLVRMLNSFGKKKRFVTGADIEKIVNMSLRRLWSEGKMDRSIEWEQWKEAIDETLEQTSVYGDGKEHLDSIAICYLHLLRNNFVPATDEPMFRSEDYSCEIAEKPDEEKGASIYPRWKVHLEPRKQSDQYDDEGNQYDKALQSCLVPRMETFGEMIEQKATEKMT